MRSLRSLLAVHPLRPLRTLTAATALLAAPAFSAMPNPAAKPTTGAIANCTTVQTKPTSIILACGDGNASLAKLRWTSWTATKAKATGTFVYNDCIPYRAAGKEHRVSATIALHGVKVTAKHGRLFTTATVTTRSKTTDFPLPTSMLGE